MISHINLWNLLSGSIPDLYPLVFIAAGYSRYFYLSLSLLLASVITKITNNRVVDFQYQSIGKRGISFYP